MKVMLLTDVNSPHSLKWLAGLRDSGVEVSCFSLRAPAPEVLQFLKGVQIEFFQPASGFFGKLSYFAALPGLRRFIDTVQPDILHAHYASSYGLLGALCRFQPFCISVWGSDIYEFPRLSPLHKAVLRYTLRKARRCFSTSVCMASETARYCAASIEVIPFGVEVDQFAPKSSKPTGMMNFATAKSLNPIYNIPLVVEAMAHVMDDQPSLAISLHIAGDGVEMDRCKKLAGKHLGERIHFYGRVAHQAMPHFFADKHVLINIPDTESFGVSVIEASAARMAIIASRAGGLTEVVEEGVTGVLIDKPEEGALREAILEMAKHPERVAAMGVAGQAFVAKHYAWSECLQKQVSAYRKMLSAANPG